MSLAVVARNAVKGVQTKSPVILTGLAVAGVFSTAILAVKATPRAVRKTDNLISDMEAEYKAGGAEPKLLTNWDLVKLNWTLYIPALSTGAATVACIIGAQSINSRRQAALVGAFAITEGAFQEYKEQVVEALGKTKEDQVRTEVVKKQIEKNPPPSEDALVIGTGDVLCLDTYTRRYFTSSMEKIRSAQNDINEMLIDGEMYMSLNEFYHLVGLEDAVVGEQVGFAPENKMSIEFNSALTPDGRPCLAISFRALPRQDYRSMFQ